MITINFEQFYAAQVCKATKDIRYYLEGFYVTADEQLVATNGHIIAVSKCLNSTGEDRLFKLVGKAPANFSKVNIEDNIATFYNGDNIACSVPVENIDGRYPDWKRVVGSFKNTELANVGIDFRYIEALGKIGKKLKTSPLLELGKSNADLMHWKFGDKVDVYLIPCRI